jgi:spore coat protein CotF
VNQNRLSDRDIAQDLLSDLKELALGYHMATVEASSQTVRDTFKNNHDDWMNEQHGLCLFGNRKVHSSAVKMCIG